MNDVSTGIVNHTHLEEEPSAPDAKGADGIGERQPQRDEEHPGGEVHAAEKRAGDEDDGDGGEDKLEIYHRCLRELLRQTGSWKGRLRELVVDINRDIWVADNRKHLRAETHPVRPQHPADEHGGESVEGHEGRVDGPFVLHPSRVQDHQARDTLEPDQRPGRQLPRILPGIPPVQRLLEVGCVVGGPARTGALGVIDGGTITGDRHDADGSGQW